MNNDLFRLIAFLATLAAIVALSKIGGTGSDLAIMTGLVGVLGGLAAAGISTGKQKVEVVPSPEKPASDERRPSAG